jgi:hypothetical protein
MKKGKILLSLIAVIFLFTANTAYSQCKAKQISSRCRPNIKKPFKYDSYAVNEFVFDSKEKTVEVQFTAFKGVSYQLVFCSSGFEEGVTMNVYNKSNRIKTGRVKLYDGAQGVDNNFWSFTPTKPGNYFIEYAIPKSIDGTTKTGCVVLLIGYSGEGEGEE